MTTLAVSPDAPAAAPVARTVFRNRSGRLWIGGGVPLALFVLCCITLPWTLSQKSALYFDRQSPGLDRVSPHASRARFDRENDLPTDGHGPSYDASLWFGTDALGRSLLGRCLLGGAVSLAVGLAAAAISLFLGVGVGLISGYRGGWIDAFLMRSVDILYGLPYLLMIILLKIAMEEPLMHLLRSQFVANLVVLFLAIGLVSWLTMARVVRGQVLSLRGQPFIEACRAAGLPEYRIFIRHLLPNLVGPIVVYATLTVPQAILQESFLSFLGIGVQAPMPTWGALASEGLLPGLNPIHSRWWLLAIPCILLSVTLLGLNFMGDGLRDMFDPRREAAKV